jgi:hypothetical protein
MSVEIHPPGEPILTLKQAAVHLVIITAGILIAFSLEGVRGWWDHRALVNEARANILSEIADNRKEVAAVLVNLEQVQKDLTAASEVAQNLAGGATVEHPTLHFNYSLAQLRTASRTTAEATGAFSYMDYDEVKDFATVYDLQAVFNHAQDRAVEGGLSALAPVQLLNSKTKPTPSELEDWKRQIHLASALAVAEQQIGAGLVKSYAELLAKTR